VPKHLKPKNTADADLKHNPMIGGSKGTTISGTTADDLEELQVKARRPGKSQTVDGVLVLKASD
jgi:hypothetical protein